MVSEDVLLLLLISLVASTEVILALFLKTAALSLKYVATLKVPRILCSFKLSTLVPRSQTVPLIS